MAGTVLGRRRVAQAALAGGAAAAVMAHPARAGAATYTPATYAATRLPSRLERHVANRFAYGWTPALGRQIVAAGGPAAWFTRQLAASSIDDRVYTTTSTWWPAINASTEELVRRHRDEVQPVWEAMFDYQRWVLARRRSSKRQLLEVMTEFWEHHFHVPPIGTAQAYYRIAYGKGIRARALGTFESLLQFAITHPAMGTYLNNATSHRKAPNEDLGRELLELHTVGRGVYDEADVVDSARILTGYRVDVWDTWTVAYDPFAHWVGRVSVLGFTDANALPDGQSVTRRYLSYLAHHPATARRIARKLAVHFVRDDPSDALVEHLAAAYLAGGTAIKPVLNALFASTEFRASVGAKVRTPDEDVVATYRVLDVRTAAPVVQKSAANAILWQCSDVGLVPFTWPRPDGRPDTAEPWSSTSRLLNSFEVHYALAGGWWPNREVTYRSPASWLPQPSIRFDRLVDHLSRTLTGRPSTSTLLRACCEAVDVAPAETITAAHGLVRWKMPRLLVTFLDQPAHLTR